MIICNIICTFIIKLIIKVIVDCSWICSHDVMTWTWKIWTCPLIKEPIWSAHTHTKIHVIFYNKNMCTTFSRGNKHFVSLLQMLNFSTRHMNANDFYEITQAYYWNEYKSISVSFCRTGKCTCRFQISLICFFVCLFYNLFLFLLLICSFSLMYCILAVDGKVRISCFCSVHITHLWILIIESWCQIPTN